jgi:hypothetical protein
MSTMLGKPPYGARDEAAFLAAMVDVTRHHLRGCPVYGLVWNGWDGAERVEDLPFVHVGLFKRLTLKTDAPGVEYGRILESSSTTDRSSQVLLDRQSSAWQAESTRAILADALGAAPDLARSLLVIDDPRALRRRGVTARTAAALSLQPLASDLFFVGDETGSHVAWSKVDDALASAPSDVLVYAPTWALWTAWATRAREIEPTTRALLASRRVFFVHSGGWKKLEALGVERERFDAALLSTAGPGSRVVDFYGLVEHVGVIYPLCERGFRHVPVWADVLVRDPFTLASLAEGPGMLALMHPFALGAPYHSVLTEDMGRLVPGVCGCGRAGKRFELLGRMPHAELRGCANV